MIVFSNTTPFIALASIGRLDLLPQLFGKVHVAQSVIDECAQGMRQQGIHYNAGLITRLAQHLGEIAK